MIFSRTAIFALAIAASCTASANTKAPKGAKSGENASDLNTDFSFNALTNLLTIVDRAGPLSVDLLRDVGIPPFWDCNQDGSGPCQNGGVCASPDGGASYSCECPSGFEGDVCQNSISCSLTTGPTIAPLTSYTWGSGGNADYCDVSVSGWTLNFDLLTPSTGGFTGSFTLIPPQSVSACQDTPSVTCMIEDYTTFSYRWGDFALVGRADYGGSTLPCILEYRISSNPVFHFTLGGAGSLYTNIWNPSDGAGNGDWFSSGDRFRQLHTIAPTANLPDLCDCGADLFEYCE